jgi:hypothetical protein
MPWSAVGADAEPDFAVCHQARIARLALRARLIRLRAAGERRIDDRTEQRTGLVGQAADSGHTRATDRGPRRHTQAVADSRDRW